MSKTIKHDRDELRTNKDGKKSRPAGRMQDIIREHVRENGFEMVTR